MPNNININSPLTPEKPKKGSGFVNLNKVIQANVGNRLGQTVAQGVGQSASQVRQGVGQLAGQFQQEAGQKNLASDANKQAASQALQNIAGGQTNVSPEQVGQFKTFLSGQYAGPRELDPSKAAQLGARAEEAQGFGQALGSGGDKTRVLQAFAGRGPYSAGQQRLDALLLGKGPQAKEQLAQARQQTYGLAPQIQKEQAIARQIGQLREGQAAQFGKDVAQQLGQQQSGIEGDIATRTSQYKTDAERLRDQYQQALKGREVSQTEALKDLVGTRLYGVDPTQFLQYGIDPTTQNVATLQQRSQLEALAKLAQRDPSEFGFAPEVYDPSQAVTFDKQMLLRQIEPRQRAYQEALGQSATNYLSNIYSPAGSSFQQELDFLEQMGSQLNPYDTRGMEVYQARKAQADEALRQLRQQHQYGDIFK